MLLANDLLAAGFKEFTDSFTRADRCFQKRVYGYNDEEAGKRTLYFINVYYYKFQEHESWELDMSFERDSFAFSYCWIKYRIEPFASVHMIEEIAKGIFYNNNGEPYGD